MESLVHDREQAIEQHELEKRQLQSEIYSLKEDVSRISMSCDSISKEKLEIEEVRDSTQRQNATLAAEISALNSKKLSLTSYPGSPFYDVSTQTSIVCPVLQSNGYIVSLKTVLSQWFQAVAAEDGYIHRTYICPVMQTPTTLASTAIQDKIRMIALHAGVDTTTPLVFSYQSEPGRQTEFNFQDQLNITARICAVQTMQVTECVERIVIQHNTMTLEIFAKVNQVNGLNSTHSSHFISSFTHAQNRDGIRIKCTAEKFECRTKYDVKVSLPYFASDSWDPLRDNDITFE